MQLLICFKIVGMPLWNNNNVSVLVSGGNLIISPYIQDESFSWTLVSSFVRNAFQSMGVWTFLLERATYLRNHVFVAPQLSQTEESTYLYWTPHLRSSLACLTASDGCAWSYLGLHVNNGTMHFHLLSQVWFHREAALCSQYLWWDDEGLWPCLFLVRKPSAVARLYGTGVNGYFIRSSISTFLPVLRSYQ